MNAPLHQSEALQPQEPQISERPPSPLAQSLRAAESMQVFAPILHAGRRQMPFSPPVLSANTGQPLCN